MHRVEVNLELNSGDLVTAVWRALIPESKVTLRNVKVSLKLLGSCLTIVIDAEDESALRATLNSLIRLAYLSLEVIKVGERSVEPPRLGSS
ncbi:MAG: KEOPS complex subunit Pcc1 [Sulfolobales archaeon]